MLDIENRIRVLENKLNITVKKLNDVVDILNKEHDGKIIIIQCPKCQASFSSRLLLEREMLCPNCHRDLALYFPYIRANKNKGVYVDNTSVRSPEKKRVVVDHG